MWQGAAIGLPHCGAAVAATLPARSMRSILLLPRGPALIAPPNTIRS